MNATIRYRLSLPHTLHSISPALSALHTSRTAALHPEISVALRFSHCPKCGTYRFSGDYPSLVGPCTRKKRRRTTSPHPKTLQKKCHLCDFSTDVSTSSSVDRSLVSPNSLSRPEPVPMPIGQEQSPSIPLPTAPPLPGQKSYPKPSHIMTSTLKDMLSRDRQREEAMKSKKRKEGHEGLAAFLKEL